MTDGSSMTLAITVSVDAEVKSVAISSDGRLVAAGSRDAVRDYNRLLGCIPNTAPIGDTYLGCSHR